MRTVILILLAAFTLAAAASAAYPVELNVTGKVNGNNGNGNGNGNGNADWMVANLQDTATITATVIQGTGEFAGQPLPGANVSFTVDSPWQLDKTFLLTDENGIATTKLKDTSRSGTANVTVTAWAEIYQGETYGYQNFSDTKTLYQPIDHNTPYSVMTSYLNKVQVGNSTRISVFVKDRYGNPVDDRHVAEKVKFTTTSSGISGFQSNASWVKSITVPVNATGYADVDYLVYPTGTNYIYIDPPSPIWSKLISIEGTAQSRPFSVTSVVSPDATPYPYTLVNTGKFTIGFTFYDQFGFPTMNQPVSITTGIAGESMNLTTNKNGMVVITYGPKEIAAKYNITARSVNNASVSVTRTVEFVSGAPHDALLTASPQTMASLDVKDDIASTLSMKVIDEKGNPVSGEPVDFRFKSFAVSSWFNQTISPTLGNETFNTSATTPDIRVVSDENGDAVATFHPGAFTTDINDPKYNFTATGSAVVEAQWTTVKRQVTLKYLNYRYLTIESEVHPQTVRVNETVDVTVRVRGDGWALQPRPIDVILVTDRSGSMLEDYDDRLVDVIAAAKVFADQLDYTRDRAGQVSFGGNTFQDPRTKKNSGDDDTSSDDTDYANLHYNLTTRYSDYATYDQNLTSTKNLVKSRIGSLVPGGNTPMRYAIYRAISETKWRNISVRALIVLSDGDYNHYGDPLARGSSTTSTNTGDYSDLTTKYYSFTGLGSGQFSNQNMSRYAKANNVSIYTIGFADGISTGGRNTLRYLAEQTGGMYYDATSANIAEVYKNISGSLRDEAGVNTTMNLSFRNISVTTNNVVNITAGDQVYDYQYIPGRSTLVDTWNATYHFPGYPMSTNDTSQWKANQTFNFNIGTVKLGQTWQSTVTLKVLAEGTINIFDNTSKVGTEDNQNPNKTLPLKIPDVFITALPNNTMSNLKGAYNLNITDLRLTNPGSNTTIDLAWNLSYNGMYDISEDIGISPAGLGYWWYLTPVQVVSNQTQNDTVSMAFNNLPVGNYSIRVTVSAEDASPDEAWVCISYDGDGISELAGVCTDFGGTWPYGPGWPEGILSPGISVKPTQKSFIKIS